MGLDRASDFCSKLARFIGPYLKVTAIARDNVNKALSLKPHELDEFIDNLWDNFGRFIAEFAFVNTIDQKELLKRIQVHGIEKLEKYKEENKPFILMLCHQANWDFLIRKMNDLYPKFAIIYRKANNEYVDKAILKSRGKHKYIRMIPKGRSGARDIIKAIKDKYSIAMLVDQKMDEGIEVPFFGRPAMTPNAMAKISMQYDYPIIPCQIIRTNKSNFRISIQDPLEYTISGDDKQDSYNIMLQVNKTIEGWVREYPAQWFWFHNRWKK
jgi:KDO2-lipid IV(A) lauroyltransferase